MVHARILQKANGELINSFFNIKKRNFKKQDFKIYHQLTWPTNRKKSIKQKLFIKVSKYFSKNSPENPELQNKKKTKMLTEIPLSKSWGVIAEKDENLSSREIEKTIPKKPRSYHLKREK